LRGLFSNHRLILVFGCGGDRDAAKRPLMGKIASDLADALVVTNDNPRSEDPQKITDQILTAVVKDKILGLELDRSMAIRLALDKAKESPTIVLIAGKGHEQTQEVNEEKVFFQINEKLKNGL